MAVQPMLVHPMFVRATKSNKERDRGFIAVDAICAAFENQSRGIVEVMTMDGFVYDVLDTIEVLWDKVHNIEKIPLPSLEQTAPQPPPQPNQKVRYIRKKRMQSAMAAEKKKPVSDDLSASADRG